MSATAGYHMNTYLLTVGGAHQAEVCPDLGDRMCAFLRRKYPAVFCRFHLSWIISSPATADEIRDDLLSAFDDIPYLLVVRAGQDAAWAGFNELDADWLLGAL